ncbi:MAG: hypothetical protein QW035_00570 [Candidatus Anstonellales archaeon]
MMAAIEKGTIAVITKGRRAGSEVVISKVIEGPFVLVVDSKGKERRMNIKHLEPIGKK